MATAQFLKTRVSPDTKERVRALAERQLVTESVLLKRLVLQELQAADRGEEGAHIALAATRVGRHGGPTNGSGGRRRRVCLRLCKEDQLLLEACAAARGMRPATYASVLIRSHLRHLTPLRKDELLALKQSISQLALIGRSINQVVRGVHQGRVPASVREGFQAMLKICAALRDHTKAHQGERNQLEYRQCRDRQLRCLEAGLCWI
jgi:hypothetical protein